MSVVRAWRPEINPYSYTHTHTFEIFHLWFTWLQIEKYRKKLCFFLMVARCRKPAPTVRVCSMNEMSRYMRANKSNHDTYHFEIDSTHRKCLIRTRNDDGACACHIRRTWQWRRWMCAEILSSYTRHDSFVSQMATTAVTAATARRNFFPHFYLFVIYRRQLWAVRTLTSFLNFIS